MPKTDAPLDIAITIDSAEKIPGRFFIGVSEGASTPIFVVSNFIEVAEGRVVMSQATLELIVSGNAKKGDVLGAARIAGIMAAKRTSDLIPLCHPLALSKVTVDITPDRKLAGCIVRATVKVTGPTGVEMEALTAVSVACLTIYDMIKAVERGVHIEGIRLVEKTGGKSGHYRAV